MEWFIYKYNEECTVQNGAMHTRNREKRQTVIGSISHATQTWYSFTAATNTVFMKPRQVFSPSQWCSWVHHSSRIYYHVTGWLVQHPRRMANSSLRSYKMPCVNFFITASWLPPVDYHQLITASQSKCNNLRLANWIFLIFDTRDPQWHLVTHSNFG